MSAWSLRSPLFFGIAQELGSVMISMNRFNRRCWIATVILTFFLLPPGNIVTAQIDTDSSAQYRPDKHKPVFGIPEASEELKNSYPKQDAVRFN